MNLSKCMGLFIFVAISSNLNAMELPPKEPKMVNLVSSDNMLFEVPLEIALEIQIYEDLKDYFKSNIALAVPIASKTLAEIVQLMQMLYKYKDLPLEEIIEKAEKEIDIHDDYKFAVAVKYLDFEPGIELISRIFEKTRDYSLPAYDYEYYMKLIQQLNPAAYKKLRECELANGHPCLEIDFDEEYDGVMRGSEKFHGYPFLFINPAMKLWNETDQRSYLNQFLESYNKAPLFAALPAEELKTVMDIIKDLAPALYDAIVEVDPTGTKHFYRDDSDGSDNYTLFESEEDGLPEIAIGSDTSKVNLKFQKYNIAHELGHYALGHALMKQKIAHKELEKVQMKKRLLPIKKKLFEIGGQLPFKRSFKHAFSRQKELEADRFAVIEFRIPIDDAIAAEKAQLAKEGGAEPKTFETTHPHAKARIEQLENLRREVELRQAQKRQPTPINWKALAAQYLKE